MIDWRRVAVEVRDAAKPKLGKLRGGTAYRQGKRLHEYIRARDNYTCQLCGKPGESLVRMWTTSSLTPKVAYPPLTTSGFFATGATARHVGIVGPSTSARAGTKPPCPSMSGTPSLRPSGLPRVKRNARAMGTNPRNAHAPDSSLCRAEFFAVQTIPLRRKRNRIQWLMGKKEEG